MCVSDHLPLFCTCRQFPGSSGWTYPYQKCRRPRVTVVTEVNVCVNALGTVDFDLSRVRQLLVCLENGCFLQLYQNASKGLGFDQKDSSELNAHLHRLALVSVA
jgi:hypothetical protein